MNYISSITSCWDIINYPFLKLIEGYKIVFRLTIGWYSEGLYLCLFESWIWQIFGYDMSCSEISFWTALEQAFSKKLDNDMVISKLVCMFVTLIAIFVALTYFLSYLKLVASPSKILNPFFKFLTFYLLLAIPLKRFYPVMLILDLVTSYLEITNFILIDIMLLLTCILACFCWKIIYKMFLKVYLRWSTINSSIDSLEIYEELDHSLYVSFKKVAIKVAMGVHLALFNNMFMQLFIGYPPVWAFFFVTLFLFGILVIYNISTAPRNYCFYFNYAYLYYIPFLVLLVKISCAIIFIFSMATFSFLSSKQSELLFTLLKHVLDYVFDYSSVITAFIAKIIIFVLFIAYSFSDTNKDEYISLDDDVIKSERILSYVKVYIGMSRKAREISKVHLFSINKPFECCLKAEYAKLANAAARSEKKFRELEDEQNLRWKSNADLYSEKFPFAPHEPEQMQVEGSTYRSMEALDHIGNLHEKAKELVKKYFEEFEENPQKGIDRINSKE